MAAFGLPDVEAFGESALVLNVRSEASLAVQLRLGGVAERLRCCSETIDAVVGIGNLTLFYDARAIDRASARERVLDAWRSSGDRPSEESQPLVEIPVQYGGDDGPDLLRVATACRMSPDEIIEHHVRGEYVAYVMGFAPGFAYIGGLDDALHTPRLERPRTRVPAGSVAIGGAFTGIYPAASPGGWNLIGRTDLVFFDPLHIPAALLGVGTRVRFVRA